MTEKALLADFKDKKWNYMVIEGSPLGNTSFLLLFLKNILLGDKTKSGSKFDRLLDSQIRILYLRPEDIGSSDKLSRASMDGISELAQVETIYNEDVFEYRNILRTLQNRQYTHLVIDEVRKKYEDNRMEKFSEIISYCEQSNIKLLVSTTDNRMQKLDYLAYSADLIFNVTPHIIQNIYSMEIEDRNQSQFKKYSLIMK